MEILSIHFVDITNEAGGLAFEAIASHINRELSHLQPVSDIDGSSLKLK